MLCILEFSYNFDTILVHFRSFLNKSQPYSLALELYHFLLNIFRQKNLSLKVRLNIFPVVLSTKISSKKNFTMKKKKSDGTKANKPEYQEYNIKILKFRIQWIEYEEMRNQDTLNRIWSNEEPGYNE